VEFELVIGRLDEVLDEVVLAGWVVVTELPGETDDVEEFVGRVAEEVVVNTTVELVVPLALAEEMHEHTAPASTLAARAVTKPQALVAHPRALMTIEFEILGMH
jgi:hypothetical protein